MERTPISSEVREQLILSARQMRSAPTPSERKLWTYLRKRKIRGFKFRRQHIIHTFIVDFYCPSAKLVVEVDGDIHLGSMEYDKERDSLMEALGYRVLRIRNELVEKDVDNVIKVIAQQLRTK
jgi:very-short-patch-repair endonuclease